MDRRRIWLSAAAGIVSASLLFAGCTSGPPAPSGSTAAPSGDTAATYTVEEVAAASGAYKVKPIYAVPKKLSKEYTLAFANPALNYPFFKSWDDGMKAAAKFYGVKVVTSDLNFKYEELLSQYQNLAVQSPDLFGSGGATMNAATQAALKAESMPSVLIDDAFGGMLNFGVNDKEVGVLAADKIIEAAKPRIAADWANRKVIVAGVTAPNCAPCDNRVKAGLARTAEGLGLAKDLTYVVTPTSTDPNVTVQSTMTDFLTAHPEDVVLVLSYGDDPVLGAIAAARSEGRSKDMLGVANGGSTTARVALRDPSSKGILIGAIDYEPFRQGWNWVEGAIATLQKDSFGTYTVDRFLTADNVDEFYPND